MKKFYAIDAFSGCGGLTIGLKQSDIQVKHAIEINTQIASIYSKNNPEVNMINKDITQVDLSQFDDFKQLDGVKIVAGCPPCQGFSSVNTRNRKNNFSDERNTLILDFYNIIDYINPDFILLENVPQLRKYEKFDIFLNKIKLKGYTYDFKILKVNNFGVPQKRKRLVLMAYKGSDISLPESNSLPDSTVGDYLRKLPSPENTIDIAQQLYSHNTERIKNIISMIPKNGGSRTDLPYKYWLACHKKKNVSFTDVYGRMAWDKPASTITGGCLYPSKGRFIHPEQNRGLTVREAALLQTFPPDFLFDQSLPLTLLSQMIGNAIPPKFVKSQADYLKSLV
ncbi:DNA (cytosine-5-)-methyltransferase [Levilactobacillus brevis]|uniref:DNA cytosine methyltransferase n=1 Tax=Levilactobacillus brevis TaxID=1580 RepID=UPI000A204125|nr:DNA cytosine methyltransferase [Levilactobacillus brevis]ARN92150.1 DNA (cytosine-5-)-methyltransferase [Levilactobacillus brevis]ARN94843.1 DNA (cytosine-5-)-methyltransferase [Levilactobacillus brevis]